MTERGAISIGLAKEISYCERMAWIKLNTSLLEEITPSLSLAKEKHEAELERIGKELALPHPHVINRKLCHPSLPFCGIPDIIAGEEEKVVLEYKPFERERNNYLDFIDQLIAYGWLVQEVLGNVKILVLYVGKRVEWSSEYSWSLYRRGAWLAEKLLKLRDSGSPPPPLKNAKCSYCFYKRMCISGSYSLTI